MLELTNGGRMVSGEIAVEWLEMLPDSIPDEIKDDEFCSEFEDVLNRLRYEVKKSIAVKPKVIKAMYRRYKDLYRCGKCGSSLRDSVLDNYCSNCGTMIGWDSTRCLTK